MLKLIYPCIYYIYKTWLIWCSSQTSLCDFWPFLLHPQVFWTWEQGFCPHSATITLLRLVYRCGTICCAHSLGSSLSQGCLMGLRSAVCAGHLNASITNSHFHASGFMEDSTVMLKEEGPSPNSCYKRIIFQLGVLVLWRYCHICHKVL